MPPGRCQGDWPWFIVSGWRGTGPCLETCGEEVLVAKMASKAGRAFVRLPGLQGAVCMFSWNSLFDELALWQREVLNKAAWRLCHLLQIQLAGPPPAPDMLTCTYTQCVTAPVVTDLIQSWSRLASAKTRTVALVEISAELERHCHMLSKCHKTRIGWQRKIL